jgi:3-oxoacyl-[acyl-carrier-protein] synthase III
MKDVYIVRTSRFLPNEPLSNDELESYLGLVNGKPSRSKAVVLRNNGIKRRYYAMKKGGIPTHNNAQLTAEAVKALFNGNPDKLKQVELLCCGTSSPDQMMPSHGVMVHGYVPEIGAAEVFSPAGNCCSGMHALKYAFLSIATGNVSTAVTTGSERLSRALYADSFEDEAKKLAELEENPILAFEKDFLRWMLSDGASAFLLSDKKNEEGLSLRIDWVDSVSYAHLADPCMYMAADKDADGHLKSYMDYTEHEIMDKSVLSMKQDVRLLDKYIVNLGYEALRDICDKRNFSVKEIDYFLPHLSSYYFQKKIADKLESEGMGIPAEKWQVNLADVGNVGAGSIYLMIDEMLAGGKLQKGQKLLLMVPESARFAYVYALLTVC